MSKFVYDTRFFTTSLYSRDINVQTKAKNFVTTYKERYVSTVTIHEVYLLTMAKEGREVARLRITAIHDLFPIVDVNEQIALLAAELRHRYRIPMADGLIAATCQSLDARCITDDPHFTSIKEIKTLWPT